MSRIIFNYIEFKNFMSYGNNLTHIDFNNEITLIKGKNGAGKTTILLALSYCLFGKTFNKANKIDLINKKNKKDLFARCQFQVGADTYILERGDKPAILNLWKNNNLVEIDGDSREFQKKLENDILKFSLSDFTSLICLGYNYVRFFELGAQARRDFIENILNLNHISEMASKLKEFQKKDSDTLIQYNVLLSGREKIKAEYITLFEEAKQSSEVKIKELKDKLFNYQKELNDLNQNSEFLLKDAQIIESKIKEFKTELTNYEQKAIDLNSKQKILQSKKEENNKQIQFFEHTSKCPTCSQLISESFCKEKINELNNQIETYDNEINDLTRQISLIKQGWSAKKQEINEHEVKLNDTKVKLNADRTKIVFNTTEIQNIEKELGKTNTNDFEEKLKVIEKEIEAYQQNIQKIQKRLEIYKEAQEVLSDKGFKESLINNYIDSINSKVNDYLTKLGCQFRIEIDSGFNETIYLDYHDEVKYESLSAGQKQRLDMSMFLTFKHIAQMRSEVSTNILLIDEIIDANLDDDGISDLLDIFKEQKNMNIFIISHKDICDKIDNMIIVKKENYGFSEITYESIS